MAFVKLDCGILDSTIWFDRDGRDIFITALLMATPREFTEPVPQIAIGSLEPTGFVAPPGWYGFVPTSGPGLVDRAKVSREDGMLALDRLGSPEADSRSQEHDGRRMIRISGGFLILNYRKYREKDHTAAQRQKRLRDARKQPVTPLRDVTTRNVTQADADVYAEEERDISNAPARIAKRVPPLDRMRLAMEPRDPLATELFEAWRIESGKTGARMDGQRAQLFTRLAAEGVTVEEVKLATRGAKTDRWAVEEAQMSPSAIIGSAQQREKFADLLKKPQEKDKPAHKPIDGKSIGLPGCE